MKGLIHRARIIYFLRNNFMDKHYSIRFATVEDVEVIAAHRRKMFADMHDYDPALMTKLEYRFAEWLIPRLQVKDYIGWFIMDENQTVIAGAGLWIRERFPHPRNLTGREGYIGNVYTEPEHRGNGHARRLMKTILDWCREHQIAAVTLHASEFGKPLYESLGFDHETNAMIMRLIDSSAD